MRCPYCGNQVDDYANFCTKCGNSLDVQEEEEKGWKRQYTIILIVVAVLVAFVLIGIVGFTIKTNNDRRQRDWEAMKESFAENVANKEAEKIAEEEKKSQEAEEKAEKEKAEKEKKEKEEKEKKEKEEKEKKEKEKKKVSTYECVKTDSSWEEAREEAEMQGGHLAVITSEDEYKKICELAEKSGLTYIWLGARIFTTSDEWKDVGWITGEDWTYEKWYPNEPSKIDRNDNTNEFYLCLWNAKHDGKNIGWTFNDQRNNLVDAFPSVSGRVGYIVEFEE